MKLNQIINLIILTVCSALCLWWGYGQREKRITAENNFAAEAKYHDSQITLTKKQAKEFYSGILTILGDKLSVKPKQITHIIQGEIIYRDTGSVAVIYRPGDTILVYPDSITGLIQRPCYDLNLLLYKGKFIEQLDYHDSLAVALYRERPHKFLFIKWGRWNYRAAMYSGCRGEVYQVINNLKIE